MTFSVENHLHENPVFKGFDKIRQAEHVGTKLLLIQYNIIKPTI